MKKLLILVFGFWTTFSQTQDLAFVRKMDLNQFIHHAGNVLGNKWYENAELFQNKM